MIDTAVSDWFVCCLQIDGYKLRLKNSEADQAKTNEKIKKKQQELKV